MSPMDPVQTLLNARFEDADDMAAALGWEFDFLQLSRGAFRGAAESLGGRRSRVNRVNLEADLHQRGTPPKEVRTFGILDAQQSPIDWLGRVAGSQELLHFSAERGFESFSFGSFNGFTISVEKSTLQSVTQALQGPGQEDPEIFDRNPSAGAADVVALRRDLKLTFRQAGELPADIFDQALAERLALLNIDAPALAPRASTRERVFRRALDVIDANLEEGLRISELCQLVATSHSTLDRAFRERVGLAPKRYLHAARLHRVRRDLKQRGNVLTVTEAANRWGFWHGGQFARDYQRQYGELPSETARG
ncbi:MAG: AraC family transcriptional regulator [Pseudomonadota bacterium]